MTLLDLFNQINHLMKKIDKNKPQLQLLKDTNETEFQKLFIETSRLVDELTYYSNQLDEISSTVEVIPYR